MWGFEGVPKGKRLKYFKDYYLISTIVLIVILIMVGSLVKTIFFREPDDLNVLVAAAQSDFEDKHYVFLEEQILKNYDIDFNGNGNEKLAINDCIMVNNQVAGGFETAEQDMVAGMKLSSVLETSLCIIQLVDEDMYQFMLGEDMIETFENLKEFGLKGEGYIKVPLSETDLDTKMIDPLYLTVRPKEASRIDPEIYKKNIEIVKQIIDQP